MAQLGPLMPGGHFESRRALLAADHLVLVELAGQDLEGGLDDATPQPQHQVEGRLCTPKVASAGPDQLDCAVAWDLRGTHAD